MGGGGIKGKAGASIVVFRRVGSLNDFLASILMDLMPQFNPPSRPPKSDRIKGGSIIVSIVEYACR